MLNLKGIGVVLAICVIACAHMRPMEESDSAPLGGGWFGRPLKRRTAMNTSNNMMRKSAVSLSEQSDENCWYEARAIFMQSAHAAIRLD